MSRFRFMQNMATMLIAVMAVACGGPSEVPEPPAPAPLADQGVADVVPAPADSPPAPTAVAAETATLYRDEWGVPHIYADTAAAGAYALGYAQAEDRFDDIFLNIRTGLGRLSEVTGRSNVDQDYIMQVARNEEIARRAWDNSTPEMRAISEQFVAGIKAYMADHPDVTSEYYLELEPWQLTVIGRAMILRWPLGNMFGDQRRGDRRPAGASNQWAVAPERSADGVAILLTDPHLSWEGMSVFYEARFHGGDLKMNGFFLVGSPVMGFGHNDHVGWAPTTGGPDTGDALKVKMKMGLRPQYEYDGEWLDAEARSIRINVKDGEPVTRPAIYTHLGPLISEPDADGMAYVGASPYWDADGLMEQSYRMCLATNNDEFYEALSMLELMDQNIMFADTSGNIGYVRNGRTYIRPEGDYDWNGPVPALTSETAYRGIHSIEDLVQIHNPESGYMQNCNISPENMMVDSPMTPDKYPDYIYNVSWDFNNPRSRRIVPLLHADDAVTVEAAKEYALDIYDVLAVPWQTALEAAVEGGGASVIADHPEIKEVIDAILEWDGFFTVKETATPIYKYWRLKCTNAIDVQAIFDGEALSAEDQQRMLELLVEMKAEMEGLHGRWDVSWGDTHVVGRGGIYFPVPGADFGGSTDGPNFSETLFDVRSSKDPGDPTREIADNGTMALMLMFFHPEGIKSYSVTPWGQSADPESPHYMDQGEKLFSKLEMKDTRWNRNDLEGFITSEKVFQLP